MANLDLPVVGGDEDAWGEKLNAALTQLNDSAGAVQMVKCTLSAAQILALNASPVQLLAPVVGKQYVIHNALIYLHAGANAYVRNDGTQGIILSLGGPADGSRVCVSITITGGGMFPEGTTDQCQLFVPANSLAPFTPSEMLMLDQYDAEYALGKGLYLQNYGSGEFTAGDGTMDVTLWYSLI